jgi:hypothetical protein
LAAAVEQNLGLVTAPVMGVVATAAEAVADHTPTAAAAVKELFMSGMLNPTK